ncbi:MAG: hypothetical protein INQ03_08090 [Candidatus Heimdallarchaeota archaeon]|nr:hypothetical protein [Candidatus Heimdallarchaeota archaeon]
MQKWMKFHILGSTKSPVQLVEGLKGIDGIELIDVLVDEDQVYVEFSYRQHLFSMHNPDNASAGYWFYYVIKRSSQQINDELRLLINQIA